MQKNIYIIGTFTFLEDTIASALKAVLGMNCHQYPSTTNLPQKYITEAWNAPPLILQDLNDNDPVNLVKKYSNLLNDPKIPPFYIAFFNASKEDNFEIYALRNGIHGIFFNTDPLESLSKGVKALFAKELWYRRSVMSWMLTAAPTLPLDQEKASSILTKREQEILQLIASGKKNITIANELCISTCTVKKHIQNIYGKIQVKHRSEAILWALRS